MKRGRDKGDNQTVTSKSHSVKIKKELNDTKVSLSSSPIKIKEKPRSIKEESGDVKVEPGGIKEESGDVKEEPHDKVSVSSASSLLKVKKEPHDAKKLQSSSTVSATSTFEVECCTVMNLLIKLHGEPKEKSSIAKKMSVLDSLVRTILSQNTTDTNSHKAFLSLKSKFPKWSDVHNASNADIEEAIKFGGLSQIKTKNIKSILDALTTKYKKYLTHDKEPSLQWLFNLSDSEIKDVLTQFNGVGPKTISCVMMFCLQRATEFPVDTHVWHIAKKLGWVKNSVSREQCYLELNESIPSQYKYNLHVLFVEHGKCCRACSKNGRLQKSDINVPCPLTKSNIAFSTEASAGSTGTTTNTTGYVDSIDKKIKIEIKNEKL